MSALNRTVDTAISLETQNLLSLGWARGWDFAVLGKAPMPKEAVWLGDWLLVPAQEDTSEIPPRALDRVQTIFEVGLRPQGFVVVHEAPKLLPAPAGSEMQSLRLPGIPTHIRSTLKKVGTGLGALAVAAGAVVGVVAMALVALMAAAALLVPFALVAAVSIDPILIAVTEDGYWVEIDRWDV